MSAPESQSFNPSLSPAETEFLIQLSQRYGTPVPKLIEQLHRNRTEAQMLASVQGVTVADVYRQRISQIKAQLEEFQ